MPVIKAVAYNFVTERCPGEVMALGINSIREVAKRIPALLEEDGMDVLVLVRAVDTINAFVFVAFDVVSIHACIRGYREESVGSENSDSKSASCGRE